MSDNFEFDDNDDVLLHAFGTPPPSDCTSPENGSKEENNESVLTKKPKLSETTSPVLQFLRKTAKKSTPLQDNLLQKTAKRIFPGPAGILLGENQTEFFSQDTTSFFQDASWEEMSKDFKISSSEYLYDKFNISWIKKEATANKFVNQKAPFLAGILFSLEVSEGHPQKSINITLRDMTGTIQGTILQNLYEEHASHFTLGSVVVIIQFGVLSCTCDKCDNHHLTITPKNLSAIYSGKEKIVIKEVNPEEVLKEYWHRKNELDLVETCKKLLRQNSSSGASSNICMHDTNRNMRFQNPCIKKNILETNIVSQAIQNSDNGAQSSSTRTNETFHLSKIKELENNTSETTKVKETQLEEPTNIKISQPSVAKKLFTFKKVNTSPKINTSETTNNSPLSNSSSSTIIVKNSSQNSISNCEVVDHNNKNQGTDNENVRIQNNQLSVKVDKVEHEKIWKDLLENVDVNSFFEDDF